jgi:hypothetical protein
MAPSHSNPHRFGLGVSVPELESAGRPEPPGCRLEALARFIARTRSRLAHRIDLSEHKIRSGSCSTSPLSGPRVSVDYKRTWSTWLPDSGAHRNRTDLGEFPIKAGSSKHAIQPPFSTKLPLYPIEFEELGFCNSL